MALTNDDHEERYEQALGEARTWAARADLMSPRSTEGMDPARVGEAIWNLMKASQYLGAAEAHYQSWRQGQSMNDVAQVSEDLAAIQDRITRWMKAHW